MCLKPIYLEKRGISVPCRKCVECRSQYSAEWANRVMLEAQKHDKNCFLTLTYADEHLPLNGTLVKSDLQKFLKRYRKSLKTDKIRFFACGEYGSPRFTMRPHYHVIIFGHDFPDKYFFKFDREGNPIYRSPSLEKLWKFGFSSIGALTLKSAKYCALYMQADLKLQLGLQYKDDPETFNRLTAQLLPPFTLMSRRPGIALDVIPSTVFDNGSIYIAGRRVLAPVAFKRKAKELSVSCNEDGEIVEDFLHSQSEELDEVHKQDEEIRREERKQKFLKIFGKSLDKSFRLMVSLKHKKHSVKS